MNILVGLGNPGRKYSNTWHNFGYWVLDRFVDKRSLTFKAGKNDYLIAKSENLACIKPTTFMNSSGLAVSDCCHYYKKSLENLLVIYDDIDLPLGTLRFRPNGGSGGHLGIESIIYHIKSENFCRLRMGIDEGNLNISSEKYVLSDYNKKFEKDIKIMIEKACDGIDCFLSNNIEKAMNKFNNNVMMKGENE